MSQDQDSDFCQFCRIKQNLSKDKSVIKVNQQFFSFHDFNKASAKQHILICTKTHVESALDIRQNQIAIFGRMKQFAIQSFNILNKDYKQEQFKFGFHLKPHISVHHIHMHGFVLPFTSMLIQKMKYGHLLYSIEDVIQKIRLNPSSKL